MLPPPLHVSTLEARRFTRRTTALDQPLPDLAAALAHLGYVQIDPLNVCGRMHDLILRNRVAAYREGGLLEFLHGPERPGFEHYLPGAGVLVAFAGEAWPHLQKHWRQRRQARGGYGGRLTAVEERVAQRILAELAERGPSTSDEFAHEGRAVSAWGSRGRLAKIVLEKLFYHGRVLIATRRNFRRVYDLPERVLPAAVRALPEASAEATARWLVELRLRQRRLVTLKPAELPLVADLVQPVMVDAGPMLYCLREDAAHWAGREAAEHFAAPRLLAPLDPLIYDRRATRRLWDFDYSWEVYLPEAKRVHGYYTLPVLAGTELVGRIEPRIQRDAGKLIVLSRHVRRGCATAVAVRELAAFLGLR